MCKLTQTLPRRCTHRLGIVGICGLQLGGRGRRLHSIPDDLVDLMTDLRNFLIPRLVPRGTASTDFRDSLKAILALAERYPAQSLPPYIPRAVARFLPALLMPCSRRGMPRNIGINARRFQKGELEALWTGSSILVSNTLPSTSTDDHLPALRTLTGGARASSWRRCSWEMTKSFRGSSGIT